MAISTPRMSTRAPSAVVLGLLLICGVVNAAEEITPAHVYQNVATLVNEVEQIRQIMGKRPPRERRFRLDEVEARQVFFQAQTLFRKCNALAREVAGVSRQAPPFAPEDRPIVPADLNEVVDGARAQLKIVKTALNITEAPTVPRFDRRAGPAEIMHDIIEAGYVLNELSSETYDWSQIYDRVIQSVTYVGGALPEEMRYPELEAFECCKMPQDVYARLALAMEAARPLAESVGLGLVRITTIKQAEGGASTETVYDLTTTLVSDFGELTLRMEGEDVPGPNYPRPARIFPSHVFQLAGVLEKQVALLLES